MMKANNKAVKKYRAGNITAAFGADLLVTGSTSIPNLLLKYYTKMDISDSEMMLLIQIFRLRTEDKILFPTAEELSQYVNGDIERVELLLDNLLDKEILSITQYYDFSKDKVVEGFDFEPLYEKLSEMWACEKVKEIEETKNILEKLEKHNSTNEIDSVSGYNTNNQSNADEFNGQVLNICTLFEREFARPLSPMEVERIRQWINEADAVLIMEALRRAVLMGKNNFRYIDAILMEWRKNNLRTLNDIVKYDEEFQQRRAKKTYNNKKKKVSNDDQEERKKLYDALLMS